MIININKMSKPEQKQVIVELQNGDKCEGVLANIDKVNLKILLVNAKKTPSSDPSKPESFEKLEINKGDIKEIKVIQFEVKTEAKEEQSNINAIPEDKKPVNVHGAKTKGYDKNESFFDTLSGMTHPEARQESKNYNDKNKDTFNLPNEPERKYHNNGYNNYHNNRGRGGYHNRGNRGRGRGGYNNYNNYNNGGNYYNNNGNFNRGGYNGRRGRGRGRGGYNNNYNIGGFKNERPTGEFANKLTPYQPEGGIQPGMEKSIYDN